MKAMAGVHQRNPALDFTKGMLVMLMVFYHWGNYFVGPLSHFYDYLRFVTPSFIFLTGAVITMLYAKKYDLGDSRVYLRLVVRGIKMVSLFTILNILMHTILIGNHKGVSFGWDSFVGQLYGIYVTGDSRAAAFKVLLPIGYLLMISAAMLFISRLWKGYIVLGTVLMCLAAQTAEICGTINANLALLSFGFVGLSCGLVGVGAVDGLARHFMASVAGFAVYIVAMTFYGPIYSIQIMGVCLSVIVLYGLGKKMSHGRAQALIVLVGKYSLVGYVGQIGILQLLFFWLKGAGRGVFIAGIALVSTVCLTIVLIAILDMANRRSKVVKGVYQLAFA